MHVSDLMHVFAYEKCAFTSVPIGALIGRPRGVQDGAGRGPLRVPGRALPDVLASVDAPRALFRMKTCEARLGPRVLWPRSAAFCGLSPESRRPRPAPRGPRLPPKRPQDPVPVFRNLPCAGAGVFPPFSRPRTPAPPAQALTCGRFLPPPL